MGGGSSNAATTLLALNRLWELGLELDALQRLAAPLGADVPVFVMGQSAWAEGVGEVLSALALPKRWFVIAQPDCTVSTAEIFADPALTRHSPPITVQAFFQGLATTICRTLYCRVTLRFSKRGNGFISTPRRQNDG